MVAAVETEPPLLVALDPVWAYVNIVAVVEPVIVTTPLKEVSVTPLIATTWPVVKLAPAVIVTVTTLVALEIELIE